MSKFKVVVTDHQFDDVGIEEKILEPIGAEVINLQSCEEDYIISKCHDADAMMNLFALMNEKVLSKLDKCKIIVRYGVGVDNVDLKAATKNNIYIANVEGYGNYEVSTHAMSLLLACARKIVQLNKSVKNKNWSWQHMKPINRLWDKQVLGLVGFGRIAQNTAQKAQAFGLQVISFDPFVSEAEMTKLDVKKVGLDDLLKMSDFVSVHVPLNEKTYHMLSESQFKTMKPTAYIVNTARGAIIDEDALYKALTEGWIAGAGLDVMEKEPPLEDNPLLNLENAIITPHAAYYSEESLKILRELASEQVLEVLKNNKAPRFLVNKELSK